MPVLSDGTVVRVRPPYGPLGPSIRVKRPDLGPAKAVVVRGPAGPGGGGDPAALPKLVINARIQSSDFVSLGLTDGATGTIPSPDWGVPAEETGSAFDYTTAGRITILESGLYAVTGVLGIHGMESCDAAMSARFRASPYTYNSTIDCGARGGDSGGSSDVVLPGWSYTYYVDAVPDEDDYNRGLIDFFFDFANFDAVNIIGSIDLGVTIQQIVGG